MSILDLADVADVDRRSAFSNTNRELVHLFDMPHHAVGVDLVIEVADFGVAGGDEGVEVLERVDHVDGGKVARGEAFAIDVGQDSADSAAINSRRDHAADPLQAVP